MRLAAGCLVFAATLLAASVCAAQQEAKPLFAEDGLLHLQLKGPINALLRRAARSLDESDATLSVAGGADTQAVKLAPRGHMRRQSGACAFPPLRISFPDKPGAESVFRGQKSLKLVTHCQPDHEAEQRLLVEYATYRMYNLLTPLSFRARLATVDYVEENGRPVISRFGFLLEAPADVARRNGLHTAKVGDRLPAARLQAQGAGRVAAFEYMIGNLDWSMTAAPKGDDCCHNTKPVGAEGAASDLVPLPYDWDSSGLIDAPYAAPPKGIEVESVRDRRYRGFCRHDAQARETMAELARRKVEVLGVLDAIPRLDHSMREKAKGYLNGFLQQASTEPGITRILTGCLR